MSAEEDPNLHDLNAFLDAELDDDARREVQIYLSRHPEEAAALMADMALAQALRNANTPPAGYRPETLALAQRLQKGLRAPRLRHHLARAAALALVFAGGWSAAYVELGLRSPESVRAPGFVDEALMSHHTALVRARMDSQPEVAAYDANEIRSATRIALPKVPADWIVTDAQVFPSDEGPSVGLAFMTPQGPVSLFGFHTNESTWTAPRVVARGAGQISYWQAGDLAFALIGPSDPSVLVKIAARLAESTPTGHAS